MGLGQGHLFATRVGLPPVELPQSRAIIRKISQICSPETATVQLRCLPTCGDARVCACLRGRGSLNNDSASSYDQLVNVKL